jgi:peptidoglycan biosynthesis protein MviN/MurJ (putative lipid II flippase)
VQLAFMLVMAWRKGLRPSLGLGGTGHTAQAGGLAVRPLLAASLNPLARVVEQAIVSFLAPGTLTVVNYGNRLISAVGGSVFFRSVVVAIVPRLTEATAEGDQREVRQVTRLAIRMMVVVSVPLTAFLAVLGQPTMVLLFRRGHFDRHDAQLLGLVLAVYTASLVGSGVQRALLSPFFAKLDTKTPWVNTVIGVVANMAILAVLVQFTGSSEMWSVVAIATAYSAAQYFNVWHAAVKVRAIVGPPFAGLLVWSMRVVATSAVAAGAMLAVAVPIHLYDLHGHLTLISHMALVGVVGVVAFAAAAWVFLRHDMASIAGAMRRRGRRAATAVAG